jgi:prepilin-type N-terminal cleavage/methylation domain-containing protein
MWNSLKARGNHRMQNILTFLFNNQVLRNKQRRSQDGFTLIELLVAMIIAALVITPILGLMVNMLDTDRKEQSKTSSQQEIQSAIDYMAHDLEQAVYIYDADGMYGNTAKGQLPNPTETNKVPVLVFWKRYVLEKNQNVTVGGTNKTASCLVKLPSPPFGPGGCDDHDYTLYSLVAYYLVKDNNTTWNSTTARIVRWEIRDGIRDLTGSETRTETVSGTTKSVKYLLLPNPGFMPFDVSLEGDLAKKLGNWVKHSDAYNLQVNQLTTLVDFIDQSTTTAPALVACNTAAGEQQVPDYSNSSVPAALRTGSFYTCVNSKQYIARLYLRGNALARIENGATYSSNKSDFFPSANIQIKGRGFLGVE